MGKNDHQNYAALNTFYSAFQQRDAQIMSGYYHETAIFSDPVFPELRGEQIGRMWHMLCRNAQDFALQFEIQSADEQSGAVEWQATYRFSQTGRMVENHIRAEFEFSDGKIISHRDTFDFWRWSRMALGMPGLLLGWTPFLQKKVQQQAAAALRRFND